MGVKLDGDVDFFFQCLNELVGIVWEKESRHVFDADGVSPHFYEFLPQLHKVLVFVIGTHGVDDAALGMRAGFLGCAHGSLQISRIIQCIENTNDGNAVIYGPHDEFTDNVICHGMIAEKVLPAKQHLDRGFEILFEKTEPLPWVFIQKTQADVKGRPAPRFDGMVADAVHFLKDRQHIDDAHAGCRQRLLSIAQYRFCDFH